jgi:carbon-monoxide dehydrogenase small subunit
MRGSASMPDKIRITLDVNGSEHTVSVEPRRTLVDVLRDDCHLTGTHIGCEHGVCGACTILVDDKPVRSCLMFGVQAEGKKIRTVEGLADGDTLHPLQKAFWENHGLQCGFCTSGLLTTVTAYLDENPDPTREQAVEAISGNLCRCTGYQNVVASVLRAAELRRERAT